MKRWEEEKKNFFMFWKTTFIYVLLSGHVRKSSNIHTITKSRAWWLKMIICSFSHQYSNWDLSRNYLFKFTVLLVYIELKIINLYRALSKTCLVSTWKNSYRISCWLVPLRVFLESTSTSKKTTRFLFKKKNNNLAHV